MDGDVNADADADDDDDDDDDEHDNENDDDDDVDDDDGDAYDDDVDGDDDVELFVSSRCWNVSPNITSTGDLTAGSDCLRGPPTPLSRAVSRFTWITWTYPDSLLLFVL